MSERIFSVAILAIAASVPVTAHAYLDPGTGSLILQLILGGLAGLLTIVKLYWSRITGFFSRQPVTEIDADSGAEQSEQKDER